MSGGRRPSWTLGSLFPELLVPYFPAIQVSLRRRSGGRRWASAAGSRAASLLPLGSVFGFRSNSSTLLARDDTGRHGDALRQLRAPGRGATAPAVDIRRRRGKPPSHRIWAGHSLRGLNNL